MLRIGDFNSFWGFLGHPVVALNMRMLVTVFANQ